MVIDPKDFPHIPWQWRIFVAGHFLCRYQATISEMLEAQQVMYFALDREHLTVDMI